MSSQHRLPAIAMAIVVASGAFVLTSRLQTSAAAAFHKPLDDILDLYVRDGYVYYQALKADRAKLDRYVASLDRPATSGAGSWPRERQVAFWVNAYNACVLSSVVDNFPIRGRSSQYPADSLRQVPGVFDRLPRRIAGRALTLDAVENTVLSGFGDPRVFFALGRAAVGSGRLRSEAFTADRLEEQLKSVAAEVPTRRALMQLDLVAKRLAVSPMFGWHEADFVAAYAAGADASLANRAPIERAIMTFVRPGLTPDEIDAMKMPGLQVSYLTFDWHLNDLATRR
jgi:hypothetical protein